MAKLLCLGASLTQVPAIQWASEAGHEVITTDYLPDNPGHRLAHRSYEISTTDRSGILNLAQTEAIDGILAFGSEPAAPTAAYVSECLNLPGNPLSSLDYLAHKGRFRALQRQLGLPHPEFATFTEAGAANSFLSSHAREWMIKPVDSSGSKGISAYRAESAETAIRLAFEASMCGEIIIEERIQALGPQIHGEGLVHEGKLILCTLGDQYFSPYQALVPHATLMPSVYHTSACIEACAQQVQELVTASGYWQGGLNIEIRLTSKGPVVIELAGRSGGSLMTRLAERATGVNFVQANVELALGQFTPKPINWSPHYQAIFDLHSPYSGSFQGWQLGDDLEACVQECYLLYQQGDQIEALHNCRQMIGYLLLQIETPTHLQAWQNQVCKGDWVILK